MKCTPKYKLKEFKDIFVICIKYPKGFPLKWIAPKPHFYFELICSYFRLNATAW